MLINIKNPIKGKMYRIYLLTMTMILSSIGFAQTKEESIKIGKGGNLTVKLLAGDINFTTWNKDEIKVKYDSDDEGGIGQLVINKDNNNVEISSSSNYYIDELNITVPVQINLEISTTAGDIKTKGDINGKVHIKTSGGDIKIDNIDGDAELKTDGGDIRTGKINGNAQVKSSGGDLKIGSVTGIAEIKTSGGSISVGDIGKNAEIKTAGGNVLSKNIGGDAKIASGGGNIQVSEVSGSADLKTGGGNIALHQSKGEVTAKTGAGNIDLKNVHGSVNAYSGAGEIFVKLYPSGTSESEVKTSSGNLTLLIPESAKVTVNAKTSSISTWGGDETNDIISDFQSSESKNRNGQSQKVYKINGGGSTISLQAVFGTIKILKIK